MKIRNIKHRLVWYSFPTFKIGVPGVRPGFVAMFPTWKVKPCPGYRWYGTSMVRRSNFIKLKD